MAALEAIETDRLRLSGSLDGATRRIELEMFIDALAAAETVDALAPHVWEAVKGLVEALRGAHILSFTNHETMVVNDLVR